MAKRPPLPTVELRSQLEVSRSELYEGIESRFNLLFYRYQEEYNYNPLAAMQPLQKIDRTNVPNERMPATFELQLRGYSIALFDTEASIRIHIAPDETALLEWLEDLTEDAQTEIHRRISGSRFDFHCTKENRSKIVADSLAERVTYWVTMKGSQKRRSVPKVESSKAPVTESSTIRAISETYASRTTAPRRTRREPDLSLLENKTLNRKQASKAMGITERTLDRWVDEGKLKPIRIGSRVSFSTNELRLLITESTDKGRQ
ncbi:MAG: hypothetical protein ABSB35_30575 [Bryobacteraceae bacterium]|jgi:predicted DNA-binding transcriptional regulator AlpA